MVLFEGDVITSLKELCKHYDIDDTAENELVKITLDENHADHVSKRAAISDHSMLWTDRNVLFEISSSFTASERENILSAMDVLSLNTCITFEARSGQQDYIFFEKGQGCSSEVGRAGGHQQINLTSHCANEQGKILHQICHALGLWQEVSRPDRDSYITVNEENIAEGMALNFQKRKEQDVDYQGTGYDYGSIMHYETGFLSNCSGCDTITVKNETEYERQGRPVLGRSDHLSPSDIIRINRLYNCPGPGQHGLLMFYIRSGVNLSQLEEDSDQYYWDLRPYVKIRAVDSNGLEVVRQTFPFQRTRNPTWNESLHFGGSNYWQFYRISVWESDFHSASDPMGMSVTVPLLNQPRAATWQRYCTTTACDGYIWYDYELLPVTTGRLRVRMHYARNLPDTDPFGGPDPYVRVGVLRSRGTTRYHNSDVKWETTNPTWNTWYSLSLSESSFANRITVQILDDDSRGYNHRYDVMSRREKIDISPGYHPSLRHCVSPSCDAYLLFDYELIPNRYERTLVIHVRYGKNLPDEDNGCIEGDSDPYLIVVAYDINGKYETKRTQTDTEDLDPEWNETRSFAAGMWTRFEVTVWDKDKGVDDRLSDTHNITLPSTDAVSRTDVNLTAYSGYVIIDYHYTYNIVTW